MNLSRKYALLFLSLTTLGLYFPTLWYDFAYDDYFQIVQNKLVTSHQRDISSLAKAFLSPTFPGDLYRPITVFTYRVQYLLFGLDPIWFHALNIILHLCCCILVYFLARLFLLREIFCFLTALLFAVHPIHVEAVANIVGRAELLATLFGVLSILLIQKSLQTRAFACYIFSLLCFLISFSSKESGMTLLGIFPFFMYWQLDNQKVKKTLWLTIPFFLIVIVGLYARWRVLGELFVQECDLSTYYVENPLLQEPFLNRIVPGLMLLGDYIRLLILPLHLCADYSLPQKAFWDSVTSWSGIFSILVACSFMCMLLLSLQKRLLAWWFLITFALTLNILTPIGTIMGERLAYLPSVGFCILIGSFLSGWGESHSRRRSVIFLFVLYILLHLTLSTLRLPTWKNNETLFSETIADNPLSPKAHLNYGMFLYNQKKDYPAAEQHFREALKYERERIEYYKNLINALLAQNKFAHAYYWTTKALELEPGNQDLLQLQEKMKKG